MFTVRAPCRAFSAPGDRSFLLATEVQVPKFEAAIFIFVMLDTFLDSLASIVQFKVRFCQKLSPRLKSDVAVSFKKICNSLL